MSYCTNTIPHTFIRDLLVPAKMPLYEVHIIPVDVAKQYMLDAGYEHMDETFYITPLLGGIRPHCMKYAVDAVHAGTLNGCLKDGSGNGVTIGTDYGEYDLHLVDHNSTSHCIYVKLKSNTVIPATTVRYIYARFTIYHPTSDKPGIYKVPYTFNIQKPTNTITVIHCRSY